MAIDIIHSTVGLKTKDATKLMESYGFIVIVADEEHEFGCYTCDFTNKLVIVIKDGVVIRARRV